MKKFLSLFLAVVFFLSCCVVHVSADTNNDLIYDFDAMPLNYKSYIYNDDGIKYNNYVIIKSQSVYRFCFFDSDDIDYLELTSRYLNFRKEDKSSVRVPVINFYYNFDSTFSSYRSSNNLSYADYMGISYAYNYNSDTDYVQNWVDNVVYSSIDVKYNDMTIYYAKNNKAVTIKDLLSLAAGDGSGSIVGPRPLPYGKKLYGSYVQKNEETLKAFTDWLIKTEKYKDLSRLGVTVTENNLYSVVDCWWDNKFSPTLFLELVKQNGVNSISTAGSVITWFTARWNEYVSINNAVVEIKTDPDLTHHRAKDVTEDVTTTDSSGNTVVVQKKDTEDILVLREILRQIINLPVNVSKSLYSVFYSLLSTIADNTYSMCLAIFDLPDLIYNNFVDPINLILDAINDIHIVSDNSDNNNVDIDIHNNSDYKVTFDDFQNKLTEKFSFYTQLLELKDIFSNAEFDETKPVITLANQELDFTLFDENRDMIHSIIIAVAYIFFFSSLLQRIPRVVGGI